MSSLREVMVAFYLMVCKFWIMGESIEYYWRSPGIFQQACGHVPGGWGCACQG
jgi:hypothetical protein